MINVIAEDVLYTQLAGALPERTGNWDTAVAPQGAYPCLGPDRWIAISVTGDAAWRELCARLELPEGWADWPLATRVREREPIERAIAARTAWWEPTLLAAELQRGGIAACEVRDVRDLLADPHYNARGMFIPLAHPDGGVYRHVASPIQLSRTPVRYRSPAPGLGDHNRAILEGLLGRTAGEVDVLEAAEVIYTTPA